MRRPRDLKNYTNAEAAALGLRDYANNLLKRARREKGLMVKWSLQVNYWTEDWLTRREKKGKSR